MALFHKDLQVDAINSTMAQCGVLLDRTLFYSESGGQISDCGTISTNEVCIESVHVCIIIELPLFE